MTLARSNTCGTCGRPIRELDDFCCDLCEDEAQRIDEASLLDAVVGAGASDGQS